VSKLETRPALDEQASGCGALEPLDDVGGRHAQDPGEQIDVESGGWVYRDEAVDMDDWSVWGSGYSVEKVWKRYFDTVGEAARTGLFDIMAHPDLVKVWGRDAPQPDGDRVGVA